jgi:hypothetical protein
MGYPLTGYLYSEFPALDPKNQVGEVEFYVAKQNGTYQVFQNAAQLLVATGMHPDDGVWVFDRRQHLLAFRIRLRDVDDLVVSIRTEIENVRTVFGADLTDGIEQLVRYFRQLRLSAYAEVSVGSVTGPRNPYDAAALIAREVDKRPPRLAGMTVHLQDVEPYPEWLMAGDDADLIEVDDFAGEGGAPPRGVGVDSGHVAVPALVWASGDDGTDIRDAVVDFVSAHGFTIGARGVELRGTWRQKIAFWTREAYKAAEAKGLLAEVEERMRIELLSQATAETGNIKADSASKLLESINNQLRAVVIFDQIVIIKDGNSLILRSVDPITAAQIERAVSIFSEPGQVVRRARAVLDQSVEPQEPQAVAPKNAHAAPKGRADVEIPTE